MFSNGTSQMLYCLIVAGSHAEKKLTEMMRKEEETNEEK